MKTTFILLWAVWPALGLAQTVINDSPETINVQALASDAVTVQAANSAMAPGFALSVPYYRQAYVRLSGTWGQGTWPVYLSTQSIVLIEGTSGTGYRVETYQQGNFEQMFWLGFGLVIGLWIAVVWIKIIRRALDPGEM